jgi:hypothetical protein
LATNLKKNPSHQIYWQPATIFVTGRKECKVHDLFCKFEDSIIVWDISILTRCPYKLVEKVELEAIYYDILYDRNKKRKLNLYQQVETVLFTIGQQNKAFI